MDGLLTTKTCTVAQLIEKLQEFPKDMEVYVGDLHSGITLEWVDIYNDLIFDDKEKKYVKSGHKYIHIT